MAAKTTQELKEEFAAGSIITATKLENLIDSVPVVRTHIETTNNTLDLTNPQNEYYNLPVGSTLLIVNKLNNVEPVDNNLTVIIGQNPVQEGEDPNPITLVINREFSISLIKVVVGSGNDDNLIWSPTVSSAIQWDYLS